MKEIKYAVLYCVCENAVIPFFSGSAKEKSSDLTGSGCGNERSLLVQSQRWNRQTESVGVPSPYGQSSRGETPRVLDFYIIFLIPTM